MEYDADVIRTFAKQLYTQAGRVVAVYTVLIGLVGMGGGVAAAQGEFGIAAIIGLIIGGLLGYAMGTSRAFRLKLAAQTALAQVQIEENTKPR